MKHPFVAVILFLAVTAQAHLGNPDVFFDGMVGPYPARVTIRMPGVIPGRAEVIVRVQTSARVETSFLPLYSSTAVTNAPAPDLGRLVVGETNLYAGELWLMSSGAYSVEVQIEGEKGRGVAQIPVTSVAFRQLPLPWFLGKLLLVLGVLLVVVGIGIAAAAGREAALSPGTAPGTRDRRNGYLAAAAATLVCVGATAGGKFWWDAEEGAFRRHLQEGAWPDLTGDVRVEGSERILRLEVGKEFYQSKDQPPLLPDHGKLMHLFLVREGSRDAFAHLHPVRKEGSQFEIALPPLPEGRYAMFCDLTFEGGVSSTATNSVVLPAAPVAGGPASVEPRRDPDDSWANRTADAAEAAGASGVAVYRLPDGERVVWRARVPLRAREDASLQFMVTDSAGEPVALEPYMGMLCHAAVLRNDNAVFAHLHPAGNFSMAAQSFFESKLETEVGTVVTDTGALGGMDHSMHHGHGGAVVSSVSLPYEFPAAGEYRIWVQFKIEGRIVTAVFDARVGK